MGKDLGIWPKFFCLSILLVCLCFGLLKKKNNYWWTVSPFALWAYSLTLASYFVVTFSSLKDLKKNSSFAEQETEYSCSVGKMREVTDKHVVHLTYDSFLAFRKGCRTPVILHPKGQKPCLMLGKRLPFLSHIHWIQSKNPLGAISSWKSEQCDLVGRWCEANLVCQ